MMGCYKFGPFLLNPETRVLSRDGEAVNVTAKTLETLLVLVQNRGKVMDKDELMTVLWPDTAVEEANLTQNVSTLRKILGDTPKDHRYIATVAGRGYQFVAPITELEATTQESSSKPIQDGQYWRPSRILLFGAAISLMLMLAGLVFWRIRPAPQVLTSQQELRRFTSLPGVETMPAFSPDGRQLAYVHSERDPITLHFLGRQVGQANIYVKLIEAGTELRVTNHPGADYHPAWSPNGEYIAFYRDDPGASGYYVVSALGGAERRITNEQAESMGIAWFPGGRELTISQLSEGSEASPLLEVSVDTGRRRQLTSPPPGTLGDAWPAFSPDGKTLAFTRLKYSGAFDLCFTRGPEKGAVHCLPVNASLPAGLAWTTAGDALIISSMMKSTPRLWRYHLKSGTLSMLTSGEEVAEYPTVSRHGSIAYVISTRRVSIYQLDFASSGPAALHTKRIAYSSRVQSDPAFSPDARKIAFVSVRSGSPEIWVTAIDTQTSTQLTHFAGLSTGSPSWSPDGKYLAFDVKQSTGTQIYVVAADGGAPRQITTAAGENAVLSWSRDGKYLYFSSNRTGDYQIWKCQADTGETRLHPASQVTQKGGFRAFESVDGSYLYYAKGLGKTGLWKRGLLSNSGVEESVLDSLQQWGWWALGPEIVYFLELPYTSPQVRLKALNVNTGTIQELAKLAFPVLTATPALAVSQDGRHLAYSQIDSMEADIMLLQNLN